MTLSDTESSILQQAAHRSDWLIVSPTHLPPGPRASIARALLNAGFVARAEPADGSLSWKLDGDVIGLSITDAGRHAIGEVSVEPAPAPGEAPAPAAEAGTAADGMALPAQPPIAPFGPQHRLTLREAATALLACWHASTEREPLADAVAAVLAALNLAPRQPSTTRAPRQGIKRELILALLRRPEGATIANVVEATGWAQHTVRGFLAGPKTKGHTVEVLARVRQNGPGNAGAKDSYSIYRLGEAG